MNKFGGEKKKPFIKRGSKILTGRLGIIPPINYGKLPKQVNKTLKYFQKMISEPKNEK